MAQGFGTFGLILEGSDHQEELRVDPRADQQEDTGAERDLGMDGGNAKLQQRHHDIVDMALQHALDAFERADLAGALVKSGHHPAEPDGQDHLDKSGGNQNVIHFSALPIAGPDLLPGLVIFSTNERWQNLRQGQVWSGALLVFVDQFATGLTLW